MPPQLSRLMIAFGLLVVLFIVVRWVAQPDSFYQYGHYRGKALSELASAPVKFIPRATCAECHEDQAKQNAAGPHVHISCQSCHGPGSDHVDNPTAENIILPVVGQTCVRCHAQNAARPASFPQIDVKDHAGKKQCTDCHVTHNPQEFREEDKKADHAE
ncbi:MAG TPA: hypothetical protein VGL38_14995 [bacterium]|jgi:hypothetical protein